MKNLRDKASQASQIKERIAAAELETAIDQLLDFAWHGSQYVNNIYGAKYRLAELNRQIAKDIIPYPDLRIERNKLSHDLLNLVDQVQEEKNLLAEIPSETAQRSFLKSKPETHKGKDEKGVEAISKMFLMAKKRNFGAR